MKRRDKGKKLSATEIKRVVWEGIVGADMLRGDSLARFAKVRQAKLKAQQRKEARLTKKLGEKDARVVLLKDKMLINSGLISEAISEANRIEARIKAGRERRGTRYLGNSATRELHDLKNETRNCQIDEIHVDHCVTFETQKAAIEAGYDCCAYCFGKKKSKR